MSKSLEVDVLAYIEGLLDLMDRGHIRHEYKGSVAGIHAIPIHYFQRVHPLLNPISAASRDVHEERVFGDVKPSDLDGETWDISTITKFEDDSEGANYTLRRYRRASVKELRGHGRLYSSMVNESAIACIRPEDGGYVSGRFYTFLVNGRWVLEERPSVGDALSDPEWVNPQSSPLGVRPASHFDPSMALGLQFNEQYEWHVDIQRGDSIELSFETDPYGAQEIFRLRDIPDGKKRRAALRNWVTQHWRKTRDAEVSVRQHLRGAEEFIWNDLRCVVRPSADDLRANERYRIEREAERHGMRRAG